MSKMVKGFAAASVMAASALASAAAHAEFTGNIGVTSNYVWRGVTQTNNQAAIQGGLDYAHESGFYAGTWLSNVDFSGGAGAGEYEWDLYAGYAGSFGDFGYDIGVFNYAYPLANPDADFTEVGVAASYGPVSAGVNYTVNSDLDDVAGNAFVEGDIYYYVSGDFSLSDTLGLNLTVGHYDYDQDNAALEDYNHYGVGLTKSTADFGDFSFAVSNTDINNDDPLAFVSWNKAFDLM